MFCVHLVSLLSMGSWIYAHIKRAAVLGGQGERELENWLKGPRGVAAISAVQRGLLEPTERLDEY